MHSRLDSMDSSDLSDGSPPLHMHPDMHSISTILPSFSSDFVHIHSPVRSWIPIVVVTWPILFHNRELNVHSMRSLLQGGNEYRGSELTVNKWRSSISLLSSAVRVPSSVRGTLPSSVLLALRISTMTEYELLWLQNPHTNMVLGLWSIRIQT